MRMHERGLGGFEVDEAAAWDGHKMGRGFGRDQNVGVYNNKR